MTGGEREGSQMRDITIYMRYEKDALMFYCLVE
jgi:hypothetical protein